MLLAAAPAIAGDAESAVRTARAAPVWTGLYIGGNAGSGRGDVSSSGNYLTTSGPLVGIGAGSFNPALTFPGDDRQFGMKGTLLGLQAGYNLQFSNFVFGIEADWQDANIRGSDSFDATIAGPHYVGETAIDWFATMRGRIGYAFGIFLPYVTGGLAYGQSDSTLTTRGGTQSTPRGPTFLADFSHTGVGYAVGGGMEVMLDAHWSAKAEYLHIDLGAADSFFDYGTAGVSGANATVPFDLIRGGVNFRF